MQLGLELDTFLRKVLNDVISLCQNFGRAYQSISKCNVDLRHFPINIIILFFHFQVDELISSTLLNVDCEEKVFSSVINWVKHDPKERKKHVSRVSQTHFP